MLTARQIKSLPKIDLHRHLEGSIRISTIYELSKNSPFFKPKYNFPELKMKMSVNGSEKTLYDFISKLGTRFMLEYANSARVLSRFAYEACEDAANDNVKYLELRCSPANYYKTPLLPEEFLDGIYKGMVKAEKDFDIKTGLIISLKREDPLYLNLQIANLAIEFFNEGKIVGVDLCGYEDMYPTRRYKTLFSYLGKNSIPITIHAGESGKMKSTRSIYEAIELLNAQRIGHCSSSVKDKNLIKMIKDRGILIEACPTSNIHTKIIDSLENHPVYKFLKEGLDVSVNTDDPVTSGITLSSEYQVLTKYQNLGLSEFKRMNLNSILYSFQPLNTKIRLKNAYLAEFEEWERSVFEEEASADQPICLDQLELKNI